MQGSLKPSYVPAFFRLEEEKLGRLGLRLYLQESVSGIHVHVGTLYLPAYAYGIGIVDRESIACSNICLLYFRTVLLLSVWQLGSAALLVDN